LMSGSDSSSDGAHGTVGQDASPDMTGSSREEVADLVDELEEKVLTRAGDPQQKIAEDAHKQGTDRAGGDVEPPA
jgi:hypothetical protein